MAGWLAGWLTWQMSVWNEGVDGWTGRWLECRQVNDWTDEQKFIMRGRYMDRYG